MTKQVQYCRCRINLAGQNCHTIILNEYNPVTWPEVQILMQLHGEENVMDIAPVGIGEVWPSNEKTRLVNRYGVRVVEACFPGRNFRMEYMMTAETDLPRYDENGQMVEPLEAAPRKPEPKKEEEPKAPPSDPPGQDHDDGEDEDAALKVAAGVPLPPIFKPGRHKPQPASA